MTVQRDVEKKTEAKSGRVGVKHRELVPKYCTAEKLDAYVKMLREKGLWSWDEDWPKDEEDWFCHLGCFICFVGGCNAVEGCAVVSGFP